MAKHQIQLTQEQRQALIELTNKGKTAVRKFKRVQMLLLSEEEYKDKEIAERVGVSVATVERTRRKFVRGGVELELNERPRSGQPRKLDGRAEAFLVATACSQAPEGRETWTMQLLAERLIELQLVEQISDETVRRVLKKTPSSQRHGRSRLCLEDGRRTRAVRSTF